MPVAPLPYASPMGFVGESHWREGKRLVATTGLDRTVRLPPRCVRCNADTDFGRGWRKTLYWHHPAYYLLILPGVLIYALVAMGVRKKVTVDAGLCPAHRAARRNRILIGWGIFLAGLASLVAAIYFGNDPAFRRGPLGAVFGLLGAALVVFSALWAIFATRVLVLSRVAGGTAWFTGAGPAFLSSLSGT